MIILHFHSLFDWVHEPKFLFFSFTDMERVLARHEEKPHVLNRAQLSIRIYHKFLDCEEGGVLGGGADKAQVSQQSEAKTQQLHIAVDPDVMEFVTTSVFRDQLSNSLAAKKSEITWKPNNKMAVIVHKGEDNSDSWSSACIDEVQNYLGNFVKRDVQVNRDLWESVKAQLSSICAYLGVDPPLVKTIDDAFAVRIVSLSTDVEDYEKKLRSKLEEIYRAETRKAQREDVPKERLILLMKFKFVEKLQEKSKKLKIKPDIEGEEIYFEGPERHLKEATEMLQKEMSGMVERKLTLSNSILKACHGSEKRLMKVKCELQINNVEAVFAIGKDARVVGTSAAHADNAARLVKKLLESENIRQEHFICSSPIIRWYLSERRQEDLLSIEDQLKDFEVKIEKGKGQDDFDISGTKEGLTRVREKLDALIEDTASETFHVEQPGLWKFFESGKGDLLVKSVEKDQDCAIQVQENFGQRTDDSRSQAEGGDCASSESNDNDINDEDDEEEEEEEEEEEKEEEDHAGSGSTASTLITLFTESQQKISWRTGYIEKEKVSVQQIYLPTRHYPSTWSVQLSVFVSRPFIILLFQAINQVLLQLRKPILSNCLL